MKDLPKGTTQSHLDEILKQFDENFTGFNDRGIVSYSDGLAVTHYRNPFAICNNCGEEAKGEKAKEWMFGHKDCKKANGSYLLNDATPESIKSFLRTSLISLLEKYGEEILDIQLPRLPEDITDRRYSMGLVQGFNATQEKARLKVKEILSNLK